MTGDVFNTQNKILYLTSLIVRLVDILILAVEYNKV